MSKFNAFRPTICEMENRTLMSVSPFAFTAEAPVTQVTYDLGQWTKKFHAEGESSATRYELENVLITSYQSGGHEGLTKVGTGHLILPNANETTAVGSSGMSAGKVSYSDLSVMMSTEGNAAGFFRLFGDADGDSATEGKSKPKPPPAPPSKDSSHKDTIQIESWSLGGMAVLENGYRYELEDVIVSGLQPQAADHKETIEIASWSFGESNPSAAAEITKVGTGTLEFHGVQVDDDSAGSHALYQDITIPTGATARLPLPRTNDHTLGGGTLSAADHSTGGGSSRAPSISEVVVTKDSN